MSPYSSLNSLCSLVQSVIEFIKSLELLYRLMMYTKSKKAQKPTHVFLMSKDTDSAMAMSRSQEVHDLVFQASQWTLMVPQPCPALSGCVISSPQFVAAC
jgi:hypothetical protein